MQGLTRLPQNNWKVLDGVAPLIERVLNLRNFQDHTPKKTNHREFHNHCDGASSFDVASSSRIHQARCYLRCGDIIGGLIEFADMCSLSDCSITSI